MAKYKNIRSARGGGGGTKTVESVPEWLRPYIENVAQEAEGLYGAGDLDNVAGVNPLLQAAFGSGAQNMAAEAGKGIESLDAQRARLTETAQSGGYDTTALKDAAVLEAGAKTAELGRQYGAGGTLGSARQAVQQGAQNAATAATFATLDRDAAQQNLVNKMNAEGAIGQNVQGAQGVVNSAVQGFQNLGGTAREIEQQQVDAPWQALQRYASTIFANPSRQSATASGGK